jgi:hypothetical protein
LEVRDDDLWVVSFPKTGKWISSHTKYFINLLIMECLKFLGFRLENNTGTSRGEPGLLSQYID